MSERHPIIAITGSSGAGTSSVRKTFEQIFRREGINAAYIEGDAFHRYDRAAMKAKVADEAALIATLKAGRIAAASIDVTAEEPLPGPSPLWDLPNVFVTPHTAGETRAYEDNVIDILLENLGRLWKGEKTLRNQVL